MCIYIHTHIYQCVLTDSDFVQRSIICCTYYSFQCSPCPWSGQRESLQLGSWVLDHVHIIFEHYLTFGHRVFQDHLLLPLLQACIWPFLQGILLKDLILTATFIITDHSSKLFQTGIILKLARTSISNKIVRKEAEQASFSLMVFVHW